MFHDDGRRLLILTHKVPGGFEIEIIIERELFALQLLGHHDTPIHAACAGFAVQRGLLMRIFAVAKSLNSNT